VQLDFAGRLALADGRYLARSDGEASEVLVVSALGAPPRRRWRRARAVPVEPEPDPEPLPLTRVTVVTPDDLGAAADAAGWLERVADSDAAEAFVAQALGLLNRALHAHATAAQDPYVNELSASGAAALRIGYGEGEQVAEGTWSDARELHAREPRRRRIDALQPTDRVAAVLGEREQIAPSESLLLRARLDLDQGREREAALQLRAGLEALLAETAAGESPGRREDEGALRERVPDVAAVAAAASGGELDAEARATVEDTLAECLRALRRRRAL
jgi:hypothetical protein